jgi:alpha-tubulin suppressor-like RCC1 family protein
MTCSLRSSFARVLAPVVTVLSLLAVTAGPASAAKTPAHTTISAHLAASTVLIKSTASVTGTVTPSAGSVALQRLVGKTWTTVGHATPTRTGSFAFSVRAPKAASTWSLKVVRAASKTAKAGNSATLHLHAVTQQFLVLATSAGAVTAPAATAVSGVVAPVTKGNVQLQELVGKTWTAVTTGKVGAGGAFSINTTLPVGAHQLRAVRPYTSTVAQGTSTAFTSTVNAAVPVVGAPTITTAALTAARVGVPYAIVLTASGGNGFYSWSGTGLPAGLTVSAAGLLAGTPTAQGTATFTVTVTDGAGHSANAGLSLATAPPAGRLFGVGFNFVGQLGNGFTTSTTAIVPVTGMTSVISAATDGSASLAVKSDGTVWAWGSNDLGELGTGDTVSSLLPVQVPGLPAATAVAGGVQTSYALTADGHVWGWGNNASGEVGDGTQITRLSPVQVSNLTSVVAISATENSAYALRSDGTVWAWGYDFDGELGQGDRQGFRPTPVQVTGLTGVTQITSGQFNGYALRSDGTVAAWGDDSFDQLGDGMPAIRSTVPITVPGVSQVAQIGGGLFSAYAVTSSGAVVGWGTNGHSELGGATGSDPSGPVTILTGAIAVGGAYRGAFALLADHTVAGWGANTAGDVGNGSSSPVATPTAMVGASGIQSLITGGSSQSVFLIAS